MQTCQPSPTPTTELLVVFPFMKKEAEDWRSWKKKVECVTGRVPLECSELKPFLQFVIEAIHPSRIYLTNVFPPGPGESEKIYELMIVIKGSDAISYSGIQAVLDMAFLKSCRVRCVLHEQGTVIEGLKNGHSYYSLNCLPEKLLYEDQETVFPVLKEEELKRVKKETLEKFMAFNAVAKDFYQSALFFNGAKSSSLVAFFLNQAMELGIRSLLIAVRGSCKKTHDVAWLLNQAAQHVRWLDRLLPTGTTEGRRLIELLSHAYTAARYDPSFHIDAEDLASLMEITDTLLQEAEGFINAWLADSKVASGI